MIWIGKFDLRQIRRPHTGPATATALLTRAELRGWTLLIAGAAYWGNVVRAGHDHQMLTLASIAHCIIGDGAFNIAAWVLIAAKARDSMPRGFASRGQIAGALAICLMLAVPTRQTTIAGLAVLGWILAVPSRTDRERQIAILLIALAMQMVWTSTYLLPLHDAVARIDAGICQALLGLIGEAVRVHGNLIENAGAGIDVEVLSACASSFPLAGMAAAFLITTVYWDRLPHFADLPWIAAALLASIALTEIRLSIMAMRPENYFWMHDGGGVTLYTLVATALAALFPTLRALRPVSANRATA
jgi:hypothetical protein